VLVRDEARVRADVALAITDEGVNGLALHVANDRGHRPSTGGSSLALYRGGAVAVGKGALDVRVAAHGAAEVPAAALFDGFMDLSFAYRFGPPLATVVHATLAVGGAVVGEAHWFPAGMPSAREPEVGLVATGSADGDARLVTVTAKRFAQYVTVDAPGYVPRRQRLPPGCREQSRVVALRAARGAQGGRGARVGERAQQRDGRALRGARVSAPAPRRAGSARRSARASGGCITRLRPLRRRRSGS